ncbi:MAG TPA: PQQ-binding-like beta-propeller repeat protein [Candidatus Paceibacterota bacterium]|nr:PQQ-binding-like beta-propeller repeat protein [Candidatus Paceibacterota bacterium]
MGMVDGGRSAYEDLRQAIAATAFVQAKDATIIESEVTGRRADWIFDFRALMLQPQWLNRYAEIFWEIYADRYPFQVGGVETAGIPLVAAIVMKGVERGTPVNGFYIRKSRKREALMKYVEGTLTDDPIIFVDDLLNTGRSVNKQIDILSREGKKVTDVFVMLAFRADETYTFLNEKNVSITHLFTLKDFGLPLLSHSPRIPDDSFETLWHFGAPNPTFHIVVQRSAPVLDETRVYLGCDDRKFRALDQKTGSVVWEFSVGRNLLGKSILSSPQIYKGVVYFGAYDGGMYALDTTTGKKIWANEDADWIGSSPDLAPDLGLLYIGLEFGLWKRHGGIAALDMKTGARKWIAHHASMTHASPLYIKEESLVVIGSNDGVVYAYDAKNGALRWTFATQGDIKSRAAYDPKRRATIIGSMDGKLYVLSIENGTPIFAREFGAGIYSIPLVHDDTVYVASLDKCIYAIDCTTWKERWEYETDGRIFSSPAIFDGSLWIGSNDGRLYELDTDTGKLKHFFQATERILSKIAYNETTKQFFVPTIANELYCLKRKPAAGN